VPLTQVSARFFLELALGLFATVVAIDRRTIGRGFTRLMAAFVAASLVPAWLLARAGGASLPSGTAPLVGLFAAIVVVLLIAAGRLPDVATTVLLWIGGAAGLVALLGAIHSSFEPAAARAAPLLLASSFASTLVLGLVTGAMILGHWYLVTPDLPVAHLGRLTKLALAASYLKLALLGVSTWWFADRFSPAAHAFFASLGLTSGGASGSFQSQLDFLWYLARVGIGLVGPIVLCHMTIATVKLKATQPATGILYAATVTVLMGELFAHLGETSFHVVL
jgi:hypothetical protein